MQEIRSDQGVVRGCLVVLALLAGLFSFGQATVFGQTYVVDAPGPGPGIEFEDGETTVSVTYVGSCKNMDRWKVECETCGETSEGTATAGSQGGMLEVSCDTQSDGSYIDNLTFNYHHYAMDYRVGSGSAGCSSCSGGVSGGGAGLMELLIERRHRSRNMTEYGSFGPGVYTNYDTKIFLNEPDGAGNGIQMDIFDPRETWKIRVVDGLEGDTLDGVYLDVESKAIKEARLLDNTDTLTTDLSLAVVAEVESHSGQVMRFEIIDLAGDAVSDEGLVGQWKFDEASGATALDSSGQGHDGTINGATRVTTSGAPVPGGAGGALSFDGVDDYVDLDNPSALNFTGEVTLAAWVKVGATDGYRNIIGHGLGLNPHGELFLRIDDGQYEVGSWNGGFNKASAAIPAEDTAGGGQWVHLAGVYDGSTWRLYRNGVLVGANQDAPGSVMNNEDWAIGARGTATARYFDGEIDEVRVYNRNILEGDIAQLAQQRVLAGRLTTITDRNGYSTDVTYKSFTSMQIDESPERQWQMDTVTDPYGRQASFTYKSTQVAGQWVVESIDLPNGEDVDYIYGDGVHLTQVDHADGTNSTFTYTADSGTQTLKVAINDAAADGDHRNKTVYLTNQIFLQDGIDLEYAEVFNQSAMMIRMLTNGTGELAYLNIADPNHSSNNVNLIYEGQGSLRRNQAGGQSVYYKDGWTFGDPLDGYDAVSGTVENTFSTIYGQGFAIAPYYALGTWPKSKDKAGRQYSYTYDADTFLASKTYQDATSESYEYNGFKQVTRHVDRLDRETVTTYDTAGNMTLRKVGIVGGVNQPAPEYAEYEWSYYDGSEGPAVSGITGAATVQPVGLMKSATDANDNTTHYVYDDDNFLIAVIQPADRVGDDRAIIQYEYDTAGRLAKTIDPLERETSYAYDSRDRIKTVTYEDGSTEVMFYANELTGGAGALANLVVAAKDRNDNYIQYRYDGHGRRVTTIRGITAQADALDQSFAPDSTYHDVEECTYLDGSTQKVSCVRNGERTEYVYDFRQRLVATIVYPREAGVFPYATGLVDPDGVGAMSAGDDPGRLVSLNRYDRNLRIASMDPYGRATFHYYRASDAAMTRTIKETVPGGSGIDFATGTPGIIINLARDLAYEDAATLAATDLGGAGYLITDYLKDAEGQATAMIDPRNVQHDTEFDSRGRAIERITAVGTAVEAKTETIFDAQSNVTESRGPRYFDATDALGYQKAFTTSTYTGRNLLASQTVAAGDSTYDTFVTSGGLTGKGAQATAVMYYYLDGRKEKTIDFNGNDPQFTASEHEWITVWRQCCERVRATIDPEGHGRAQGTDFNGNVTHTAAVESLIDDVIVNADGSRTIADSDFGGPGIWDVPDARTLSETTTRFDSKNRPVATTVWLEPLGLVDPNDAPILYSGSIEGGTNAASAASGLGVGDGLTTLYYYSEDLMVVMGVTAGVEGAPNRGANDNNVLVHQYGPDIDLSDLLDELSNDDISVLDLGNTNASARATINPEGEISVTIMDGVGRPVIAAKLDPATNNPVTWSTVSHDRVSDAALTDFGYTLETMSISALDNLNRSRSDAAGRTIEVQDDENKNTWFVFDNNGNLIRFRDSNSVGRDWDRDSRNREILRIDTQGDEIKTFYNSASMLLNQEDAKNTDLAADVQYDARGRLLSFSTRLHIDDTNEATYDPNGNLLTQTDAEGGVTAYEYDPRNLRIAQNWPGHNTFSSVGDSDYDRLEMLFDALGRPFIKADQLGDTTVNLYDLAGRITRIDHRTEANSTDSNSDGVPDGSINEYKVFVHDDASRVTYATRTNVLYNNAVTRSYDHIGRLESEEIGIGTSGTFGFTAVASYTTLYGEDDGSGDVINGYDDDSRSVKITYPDGSVVDRTYTGRNQVEDIDYTPSGGSATTIATSTYDVGMREDMRELGNGLEIDFAYRGTITMDGDNLLDSITTETAPSQDDRPGLSFTYSYDANKNLTAEDTGGNMDDFGFDLTHDAKDRMTGWDRDTTNTALDSQDWTLSYEANWDEVTATDGGVGTTDVRTHDDPHQLRLIEDDLGNNKALLAYDAKGNPTATINIGAPNINRIWNFDNQLTEYDPDTGVAYDQVLFAYDALGRRVLKRQITGLAAGPVTVYAYAGQQVIAEYEKPGGTAPALARKYVYGNYIDEPIVLIDDNGSGEDIYYYHRNRQYSVVGLSDDTGTVIERYAYTAYGELTVLDANGSADADNLSDVGNPYAYTGRRIDPETGLHYFRARYYDPQLGRFLQRDPLGYPDGMNGYAAHYVMHFAVDPLGYNKVPVGTFTIVDALTLEAGSHHNKSFRRHTFTMKIEPDPKPWVISTANEGPGNALAYVFPEGWGLKISGGWNSESDTWRNYIDPDDVAFSSDYTLAGSRMVKIDGAEEGEICWQECRYYWISASFGQGFSTERLNKIVNITLKLAAQIALPSDIADDINDSAGNDVNVDVDAGAGAEVEVLGEDAIKELEDALRELFDAGRVAGSMTSFFKICADGNTSAYARKSHEVKNFEGTSGYSENYDHRDYADVIEVRESHGTDPF